MKIGIAQINTTVGALDDNINIIIDAYNKLKAEADLIIFPELCVSSYPLIDLLDRKDFIAKQNILIKNQILPIVKNIPIILGAITISNNNLYNSALFIHKHKIKKNYNKRLLPTYDLFNEKRYFKEGEKSKTINYKNIKIGLSICEDMWSGLVNNKYSINPMLDLKDADIIVNISASPYTTDKDIYRHRIMKKYSKLKTFIFVNQVGANDSVIFDGKSKVYKNSKLIYESASFKEDIKVLDLNYKNKTIIKAYNEYENIFNALSLGIKDYFKKNNLNTAILGLSGGIDSAIVLILAANALGKDNVKPIFMPSIYTSNCSLIDCENLCANLNISLIKIPINNIFNNYKNDFLNFLNFELKDLAEENIQSRIRSCILNAYANSFKGAVLLNTGNKSELATGYCTLYGDTCGALSVIGDLYKTKVYDLAAYINKHKIIIPENIIKKAPSAELNFNQKDEDSLGEYAVLDKLIKLYIEEYKSYKSLSKLFNKEYLDKIINLINKAEFKRAQMPPILKISNKAFNVDRKWAITNKYY